MKRRKGEIATILTIATLVVIGVTAIASSFNLNKKQTTSSRADESCKVQLCGSLSTNGSAKYYAKYISGKWKYYKEADCKTEAVEGVGNYCKSQNYAEGNECLEKSCSSPNEAKKYYQWKTSAGGKNTSKLYSDKGVCSVEIPDKEQYCKTAGGPNVTPAPGQNPPNWGVNKTAAGCGYGGENYQFGSCYQGRRCVQCQHGGKWLSYDCFEDDSTCTGDTTYCESPWKVTTCSNGVHKCCDATAGKCIKSGNKPTDPTENISECVKPAEEVCSAASGEYCSEAGGTCESGDAVVSPAKICDSATNKRCCKKSNTCDAKDGYKCISSSTSGATDDEKCRTAGKDHKAVDASLSCGDSNKICCYGTYIPPADSCTPITEDCPKEEGVEYTYYKSNNDDCDVPKTGDACYGTSKTSCKLYTKKQIQDYNCSTGTLPAVTCSGETAISHTCKQYCETSSKTSSSPTKTYAYTGTGGGVKYWTDTTCKTSFDPTASCGCETAQSLSEDCQNRSVTNEYACKSWCNPSGGMSNGGNDKKYYGYIASHTPPWVQDDCKTGVSGDAFKTYCGCGTTGCSQDVTGCREITVDNQSCYTDTHVTIKCDGNKKFCCPKPADTPTKIFLSFKNGCDSTLSKARFAPAFSGYYYEVKEISPGETSAGIDISEHCKSWGFYESYSMGEFMITGIDCTQDGKTKYLVADINILCPQ